IGAILSLVVFGGTLPWQGSTANSLICLDRSAGLDARTEPGARARSAGGWCSHDYFRLELCARRSPVMVASSTANYQRIDGDLRHIVAGHLISRSSLVADPGHHTRVRNRSDDRFNEAAPRTSQSAERALVPSSACDRCRLRNLCCARLAKDA